MKKKDEILRSSIEPWQEQRTIDALTKAMQMLGIATQADIQNILRRVVDIEQQIARSVDDLLSEIADIKHADATAFSGMRLRSDMKAEDFDARPVTQAQDAFPRLRPRQANRLVFDANRHRSEHVAGRRLPSSSSGGSVVFLGYGDEDDGVFTSEDGCGDEEDDEEEDEYLDDSESGTVETINNFFEDGEEEYKGSTFDDKLESPNPLSAVVDTPLPERTRARAPLIADTQSVSAPENHSVGGVLETIDERPLQGIDLAASKEKDGDLALWSRSEPACEPNSVQNSAQSDLEVRFPNRTQTVIDPLDAILENLSGLWDDQHGTNYRFLKSGSNWFCEKCSPDQTRQFRLMYDEAHARVMWGQKYYLDKNIGGGQICWHFVEGRQRIAYTWKRRQDRTGHEKPVARSASPVVRSPSIPAAIGSALSSKRGWPSQPNASRNCSSDRVVGALETAVFPSLQLANQISGKGKKS